MKKLLLFVSAFLLISGARAVGPENPDDAGGSAPGLVEMKVWVHVNDASTGRPVKGAQVALNVMLDNGGPLFSAPVEDVGQLGDTDDNSVCELDFEVLPNPTYRWHASGWVKMKGYYPAEIHDVALGAPHSAGDRRQDISVSLRPVEAADASTASAR